MDKDTLEEKVKGKYEQARGSAEQAAGDLTGDDRLRGRGEIHEEKGKLREAIADAKEGIKGGVERAIGKLKHEREDG